MTKAAHRRQYFFSGLFRPRAFFAAAWVGRARMIRRTRRELAAMDDRMLSDIGISRGQAQHEANRKFWSFGPPPEG